MKKLFVLIFAIASLVGCYESESESYCYVQVYQTVYDEPMTVTINGTVFKDVQKNVMSEEKNVPTGVSFVDGVNYHYAFEEGKNYFIIIDEPGKYTIQYCAWCEMF